MEMKNIKVSKELWKDLKKIKTEKELNTLNAAIEFALVNPAEEVEEIIGRRLRPKEND